MGKILLNILQYTNAKYLGFLFFFLSEANKLSKEKKARAGSGEVGAGKKETRFNSKRKECRSSPCGTVG